MTTVSASTPLWVAAGTLLAARGKDFFTSWRKAAESFDPEDIHDFRVASRRLREGIALFAPCFPAEELKAVAKKVKKLTRLLGEMRNTDEATLFFSSLPREETVECRKELELLLSTLALEREAARRELERGLARLRAAPLRGAFRAVRRHPRIFGPLEVDPFQPFASFARDSLQEREQPVRELIPRALKPEEREAQHRLRIAVKHLRYRLEILEPLLGATFPMLQQNLKRYQELLGKLHDLDVFAGMLEEKVPRGHGQDELLRLVGGRRSALHQQFQKLTKEIPLDSIGQQAREAL